MTVIRVEHLSKQYRLGMIGGATLREEISRWWALKRGKEDPLAKVGTDGHKPRIGERFWALKDVSFEVKQGEILGIIGRNGAGKSTLLKILSRITAPTEGIVKIKGRIGSLLEVGTGFHPELTGRENIYLNGAILGMSRREVTRKLDEIIAFSEVEQFIDTPVKRYSSGMYVRLAFAVAAHLDPEILIVDEVLAVGDAAFQKKCLGKMGEVAGEGRTVLFVSHNMASVSTLCSRVGLIHSGQWVGDGSPQPMIRAYHERFAVSDQPDVGAGPAEVTFEPRHDRDMTLLAIRAVGGDGSILGAKVPVTEDFVIEIDYAVNRSNRDAYVTCGFIDLDGGDVWWRYDADTHIYGNRQRGRYRAVLTVPAGFLRPGTYGLRPSLVDPTKGVLDYRGIALRITFGMTGALLDRRGITWPSVVRYEPGWTTLRMDPGDESSQLLERG